MFNRKGNSEDNNLEMTGETAEKILRYTEAAERGRRGKNCKQLYQGCKKGLKVSWAGFNILWLIMFSSNKEIKLISGLLFHIRPGILAFISNGIYVVWLNA